MTDPTRPTGATLAQIEAGIDRCLADEPHRNVYGVAMQTRGVVAACAIYLVPPDQCIVPRSFVAAVDAAISEAEELDYSPPYIRIPLGKWHDVANARDTFREATS